MQTNEHCGPRQWYRTEDRNPSARRARPIGRYCCRSRRSGVGAFGRSMVNWALI